jgi:hypothetical protein
MVHQLLFSIKSPTVMVEETGGPLPDFSLQSSESRKGLALAS